METEDQLPSTVFVDVGALGQEDSDLIAAIDRFQIDVIKDETLINSHTADLITTVYQLFQHEEYLMETSRYPLADIHTMEHNRLVSDMVHAVAKLDDHDLTAGQIADKLRKKFRFHADNFDKVLFEYLRKKHAS